MAKPTSDLVFHLLSLLTQQPTAASFFLLLLFRCPPAKIPMLYQVVGNGLVRPLTNPSEGVVQGGLGRASRPPETRRNVVATA
jgi:hypothetical protein